MREKIHSLFNNHNTEKIKVQKVKILYKHYKKPKILSVKQNHQHCQQKKSKKT